MEFNLEDLHHSIVIKEEEASIIPESEPEKNCKSPQTSRKAFSCKLCDYTCESPHLRIKTEEEKEEMEFNLEDLHHSIDIKEDIPISEFQKTSFDANGHCKIQKEQQVGIEARQDINEEPLIVESQLDAVRKSQTSRSQTGKKLFVCEICEKTFLQKVQLKSHSRVHTGAKPYACEICDYKCAWKKSLKNHSTTHTGEKRFSCEICDYKCSMIGNLNRHLKIHTSQKRFACEVCNNTYSRNSHLKNHLKAHTGEKPYACAICDYKSAWRKNLRAHLRVHSNVKKFSCEICDYRSSRKVDLNRHMRTHK